MRAQVSLDALVTGASVLAVSIVLISAFYGVYTAAERGVRLIHLKYLSQVIEDRMKTCNMVDGVKIYAPYTVLVDCGGGKVCYRDLCVDVSCSGGGEGKTFVVRGCRLIPT